jgi:hypothetical protein
MKIIFGVRSPVIDFLKPPRRACRKSVHWTPDLSFAQVTGQAVRAVGFSAWNLPHVDKTNQDLLQQILAPLVVHSCHGSGAVLRRESGEACGESRVKPCDELEGCFRGDDSLIISLLRRISRSVLRLYAKFLK